MIRTAFALIAALAIAPAAQAQIRAGTYDLEIAFGGGVLQGRIEISLHPRDSIALALFVADHQSPVRITRREGNRLILGSTAPGMDISYELDFRGDTVTGPFRYSGETGSVTGRRRGG